MVQGAQVFSKVQGAIYYYFTIIPEIVYFTNIKIAENFLSFFNVINRNFKNINLLDSLFSIVLNYIIIKYQAEQQKWLLH